MATESSSSISTKTLLERLVLDAFGTLTVARSKWPDNRTGIPRRSYFADRIKNNAETPINHKCANHILAMYRIALTEKTGFDRFAISKELAKTLSFVAGTSMHAYELVNGDTKEIQVDKIARQIQALETLLSLAQEQPCVSRNEFRKALASQSPIDRSLQMVQLGSQANLSKQHHDADVEFLADSVADAGYSSLILQTGKELDISHFHGAKWTEANYPALSERFSYGNLTVRVVLASYDSPFFEPYAMLKNTTVPEEDRAEDMKNKVENSIRTWVQLYEEAESNGAQNLNMKIYLHKQTPSMAIYRFDQTMVITPTKSSMESGMFPAFKLFDSGSKDCAFRTFLAEFDSLASLANFHEALSSTTQRAANRRDTAEFLKKLLLETFGVTTINYNSWSFAGIEQRPNKLTFTERLNKEPLTPLDGKTAGYLIQTINMALDGRAPIDAVLISQKVIRFLMREYGIDIRQYLFRISDSPARRTVKRQGIVNVLNYFTSVAANRKAFDLDEVMNMIGMEFTKNR